jgi:hypothetical protein
MRMVGPPAFDPTNAAVACEGGNAWSWQPHYTPLFFAKCVGDVDT